MLTQEGMTVNDIELILKDSDLTGYPIVISKESQYLLGYILRRDILMAFSECTYIRMMKISD